VCARFDAPQDADWYEFKTTEKGPYAFEVLCDRIAGRGDPYLVIFDDTGKRVDEVDDANPNQHGEGCFARQSRDPLGMVDLEGGKTYKLLVQDRYGRGGPRMQYVLEVRRPRPDFMASVVRWESAEFTGTTVRRGGANWVHIAIDRFDGFDGTIEVRAENLPPGLHAAPVYSTPGAGIPRVPMVFWSDTRAQPWAGPVTLAATAQGADGNVMTREVRPAAATHSGSYVIRSVRQFVMAQQDDAPYHLKVVNAKDGKPEATVTPGGKIELKLVAARRNADGQAAVNAGPWQIPYALIVGNAELAAGQTEATFTAEVREGSKAGSYTLVMQGQMQVPFSKDPAAKERPMMSLPMPSEPFTVHVTAKP
jgi:hypothetical protein